MCIIYSTHTHTHIFCIINRWKACLYIERYIYIYISSLRYSHCVWKAKLLWVKKKSVVSCLAKDEFWCKNDFLFCLNFYQGNFTKMVRLKYPLKKWTFNRFKMIKNNKNIQHPIFARLSSVNTPTTFFLWGGGFVL